MELLVSVFNAFLTIFLLNATTVFVSITHISVLDDKQYVFVKHLRFSFLLPAYEKQCVLFKVKAFVEFYELPNGVFVTPRVCEFFVVLVKIDRTHDVGTIFRFPFSDGFFNMCAHHGIASCIITFEKIFVVIDDIFFDNVDNGFERVFLYNMRSTRFIFVEERR